MTFYLYYAETLIILLILASIFDQIAVLRSFFLNRFIYNTIIFHSLTDDLIIDINKYHEISMIFALELIIDLFLTMDFVIKVILRSYFLDSGFYGFEFLIFDVFSGPIVLLFDLSYLIFERKLVFLGFLLRTSKVFTMGFLRFSTFEKISLYRIL